MKLPYLSIVTLFLAMPGLVQARHNAWDAGHNAFQPIIDFFALDPGSSNCNTFGSPIEVATGNFQLAWTDFQIPASGLDLSVTRTYNSSDRRSGLFGMGWSFTYDVRLISTTDGTLEYAICKQPDGKRIRFVRNADGSYASPPEYPFALRRNPDGTFSMTEVNGATQEFTSEGFLRAVRDRNGGLVQITLDGSGFPTEVRSGEKFLRFARGADGKVDSITDPLERTIRYRYDTAGNLSEVVDPLGRSTKFAYDANRRMTRITDPRGNSPYVVEYDAVGRVSAYTENGGRWTVAYEPGATTETDPGRGTWRYEYNANGNITKATNPLGNVEEYAYDRDYNLSVFTDGNGNRTRFNYDALGRQISDLDALGASNQFSHDGGGRVVAAKDAGGGTLQFGYDEKGNLASVGDSLNRHGSFEYDSLGQLVTATDPAGQRSQFRYDGNGNTTEILDPLQGSTQYTYDAAGNVLSRKDAEGRATSYQYDANGQLLNSTDPAGGVSKFTYDEVGNLTSVIDLQGNTTTLAYDLYNRLTKVTDPGGAAKSFAYDALSRLASATNARGQATTFTYDQAGRLTRKSNADGIATFVYDDADNLIEALDSDSRILFEYDKRNRIVKASTTARTAQNAWAIEYEYDATDNLRAVKLPNNRTIRYAYDSTGQPTSVTGPAGDVTRLGYDEMSRLTRVTMPNQVEVENSFDPLDRLTQQVVRGPTSSTNSFTYDRVGNRRTQTSSAGVRNYTYDALDRLTGATGTALAAESYEYTGREFRSKSHLSASYRSNLQGQLLEDDQYTYTYDLSGNLSTRTSKANAAQKITYTYSVDDQLTLVVLPDSTRITYAYDGFGRRIEKRVGTTITRYVYSGEDIVLETDGSGTIQATYVHGPGADNPISMERGGATYYYVQDALGSVVALTNNAGAAVRTYQYDSFGRIASQTGTLANPYTYTGREFDAETGLFYYRARYYDAGIGRFLQTDPVEVVPSYGYVENNPLIYVDPSGQILQLAAFCAGGALTDVAISVASNAWAGRAWNCGITARSLILSCVGGAIGGAIAYKLWRAYVTSRAAVVGLGITGTRRAVTVAEKLAIEAAESNPAVGKVLQTKLTDPRWPASEGWVKMGSRSPGGIVVHWVRNIFTGAAKDFKLK